MMMAINPITLSGSLVGDGAVTANRRFDRNNEFDAALWKFLFYWNYQVRGISRDEIDILWRQHTGTESEDNQ